MPKFKAIPGGKGKERPLTLLYGLRLYPAEEVAEVQDHKILLKDGTQEQVTLHLIEGTREQIRSQLLASIDAFFDICEGNDLHMVAARGSQRENEAGESGC